VAGIDDLCRVAPVDGGVLVGHDGSPDAHEALCWAGQLAARTGVRLHVLRAWRGATAPWPAGLAPDAVPSLLELEQAVRDELQAAVDRAALDPLVEVSCHVTHGSPARGLVESAEAAELLVVGARGRGGSRGRLGSVSDACVRQAPCPVTVVRARRWTGSGDPAAPHGLDERPLGVPAPGPAAVEPPAEQRLAADGQ
jgi:nucleotide-binding universal stress UspA family protein